MSKRTNATHITPDVAFDTDEDGTKVIIRKFDIPLPPKQGKILASEKKLEKWKYQHDVPEGRIFTKRVHADVSPVTIPQNEKKLISSIPNSSVTPKISSTSIQNIQLVASAPTCKDIIVVPPKEQSTKVLIPAPKTICSDKITLNNLPENVIANSITVFDSKFVNGRKVLYLKAAKVPTIVGSSVKGETEVILTQSEVNTSQLKCIPPIPPITSTITSVINPVPPKPKELRCYYPSRVARVNVEKKGDDVEEGISILKPPPNPPPIPQKMKFTSREVPVGNKLEHTSVVCDDCDSGSKKKEVQIHKPITTVVPTTVTHSLRPFSILPQNKREVFTVLAAESIPGINSGILPNIHDAGNSGKEITKQINSLKTNHILIDASKQKVNLPEGNISVVGVEFLNSVSNNTSSNSGLHVENQSAMNEGKLKFVPADSTTPTIVNVCSTSAYQKTDNLNSTEPKFIVGQENLDKEHRDPTVIGHQSHSNSLIDSNNIYNKESKNSIQNIVIVNPPQNVASCNTAAIPKPNIDEIMRRRKIALKFQQDMQRAKETPRIERTLVLPARKVNIVDSSTQTSLFCMLEPGRMVEMFLNDHPSDSKITKQCGNQDPHIEMKEKSQIVNESNSTFISNDSEPYKASFNCQTAINDQINPPLSKRIRLDNTDIGSGAMEEIINSNNRIMNNDPLLTSSMDFQDIIPSFETLEKENIESTNINTPSRNYETYDLQKNNNSNSINNINNINNISAPLSCLQSTLNRNVNGMEKNAVNKFVQNKEVIQTLLKDYRDSLIPDEDGNLPLHNAVMDRDIKQVQRQCLVLTARKQSVDVKNIRKETALHLAVLCHDLQITKALLKFKAKPSIPDGEGNTPVHMAIKWGKNIEILQELLTYVEDNSPILNMPNDEGFSPLHLCALLNKPSEAVLLMRKNVEVNIRDRKSGRTPLFHAVENGNSEISQVLLNAGAHTHIPNFSGQTALNASELTFVLDELSRNVDPPKTVKPQVVPCVCRDKTKEDRTSNVPLNRNILVFERTDINVLNSNNDICNINLLDTVLHNR